MPLRRECVGFGRTTGHCRARLKSSISLVLLACSLLGSGADAAEFRFGINAEVSYKESEAEIKRRYATFLEELGRVSGHKFVFFPVYSDRVEQAVAGQQYDLLLIHTHLALKATREHKFQVLGFTDDRKNNQVYFFVSADSTVKTLAAAGSCIFGVPGMQSWATATAYSTLKGAAIAAPKLEPTRFQEAVPIMLEVHKACVGVTRSKSLVDNYVSQKKGRVLHVTPPRPLNALIASPNVPTAVVEDIRSALTNMAQSKAVFDSMAFKGVRYSTEEHRSLNAFYQ
jgi:ABC-type phosphate/phosphonate transport system substrate-binding protein